VAIRLPSGRKLYYRDIRREAYKGKAQFTGADGQSRDTRKDFEWKHGGGQKIYGGLLAENVTQAVARDIIANSILECEQAGYPVVVHVHDEIVCRVPRRQADEALAFLLKSLSTGPAWADGLPLSAEGGIKSNLGK
jgi:DNA polymerase